MNAVTDGGEIPFGDTIPINNPHAISVSLPRMADVVGVMCGDLEFTNYLYGGYPRFNENPLVAQAREGLEDSYPGQQLWVVNSERVVDDIANRFPLRDVQVGKEGPLTVLAHRPSHLVRSEIRTFLKDTGGIASSRRAEDWLIENYLRDSQFPEEHMSDSAEVAIIGYLNALHIDSEVWLSNTGMSAVYTVLQAVDAMHQETDPGRRHWLRVGWLYSENQSLLQDGDRENYAITDVDKLDIVEEFLKAKGSQIAGVLTEAPTNPQVRTVELEQLADLLRKHGIPLVVDVSVAGSAAVDVLPYADVVVESLTKFPSGGGDLMMGYLALNRDSRYAPALRAHIPGYVERPYERDVQRMAHEIQSFQQRLKKIGANTISLAQFFESHDGVSKVHWSGSEANAQAYRRIARNPDVPAGIISLELADDFGTFYDNLRLPKGPSFGTEFTLNTPYFQIAHWGQVSTPGGQAELAANGLNPETLRVSVGTEDPDALMERYSEALRSATS